MCGIVGYVGGQNSVPILLEGLRRLEYRGYDSAGIAVAGPGQLRVHKAKGKVAELAASAPKRLAGTTGIGHTRWATHGAPSEVNAHPQLDSTGRIAVVHNGIIENAGEIRAKLEASGVVFVSETDTEVLAHLIARATSDGAELADAVRQALRAVEGTYGIAVIDRETPGTIVVARNGSPVIIGIGGREHFVASDVAALVRYTQQVVYLDDGEIATVRANGYQLTGGNRAAERRPETVAFDVGTYDQGSYPHFLAKEIQEQPEAVERALSGRIEERFSTAHLGGVGLSPQEILRLRRVRILGCGSGYYAALAGAALIERIARLPAEAEVASEFRYRNPVVEPDTLFLAVSQSGETLDTLRAVEEVRRKGGTVLGVVNVVGSSIARECGAGIYLHAGPEVSVTSTKSFTSTLVAFALLAVHLGRVRDLGPADGGRLLRGLRSLPALIATTLRCEDQMAEIAAKYATAASSFYVGRVTGYPVALEGAQKLKEISYVHAEAYPAAELKHGPLALVTPALPTVAVVPNDELFAKNVSTANEIRTRGGPVVAIGHSAELAEFADDVVVVPRSEPELDPILLVVPLQLLAYHAGLARGVDIDQPRNLAKSVTVE
jgi:glucosamine--fructose-6-phosphate aminotransferase (isomerizing)